MCLRMSKRGSERVVRVVAPGKQSCQRLCYSAASVLQQPVTAQSLVHCSCNCCKCLYQPIADCALVQGTHFQTTHKRNGARSCSASRSGVLPLHCTQEALQPPDSCSLTLAWWARLYISTWGQGVHPIEMTNTLIVALDLGCTLNLLCPHVSSAAGYCQLHAAAHRKLRSQLRSPADTPPAASLRSA